MSKHFVATITAVIIAALLALTGPRADEMSAYTAPMEDSELVADIAEPIVAETQDCAIKGNIAKSGERVYHVPGGALYGRTQINEAAGERWFCTEQEAVAAGWRRSLR